VSAVVNTKNLWYTSTSAMMLISP